MALLTRADRRLILRVARLARNRDHASRPGRRALERLVDKFGLEAATRMVNEAVEGLQ